MAKYIIANPLRLVLLLALLLSLSCAHRPGLADPSGTLTLYATEQQAQKHCPKDTVVWLNLPSGIYHFKGQRWYSNTNNGAFVCEKEADKAGDRATRNGQ
jgi:hypothetical protein